MTDRDTYRDAQRVFLSLVGGFVAPTVMLLVVGVVLLFSAGRCSKGTDVAIQAKRDTVRLTDSVRVVMRDTVTRYRLRVDTVKDKSDALDAAVAIVNDSTVMHREPSDSIHVDSVAYKIPPFLIKDVQGLRLTVATQDTLLHWWERKSAADSMAIVARDRLIVAMPKPPRCGWKCGAVLGFVGAVALHKAAK
jgi:hypothetical protein